MFCVGSTPVLPRPTNPCECPTPPCGPRAVGCCENPIGLSFADHASFFPVTYRSPVFGLNDDDPRLGPPINPGDWMMNSLTEYGVNIGRTCAASSGSMFGGYVAQNGVCGTKRAV